VAELQKNMPKGAPDLILISETLPESTKAEIRNQITNIPTVTMPIPVAPASGQPVMSGPMPRQTPEEMAYERALRGFEEALFDALEKINPADRPIYVSFVTM